MQYITTSSYGQLIGTIPDLKADENLITHIRQFFAKQNVGDVSSSTAFQRRFIALMEEAIRTGLTLEGTLDRFSDVPDHYNRPLGRYILKDKTRRWNYIVDVLATLDIKLEISKPKRFLLTHLPFSVTKLNEEEFVPKIHYQYRLWNTPVSHYLINVYEANMNVRYSSKVERARQLIGLPKIYDPKEPNCYERIDYDIRRALFNEVTGMLQSGIAREGFHVSGRDDHLCDR